MTRDELLHAAMLALAPQNVTPRPAPRTTRLKSAMCINRNIAVGEPVVVYYNDAGELLRLGDVPEHSGDFFVDESCHFYCYDAANHRLVLRDGLSGEIINDTEEAYGWSVFQGGNCAAYKVSQEDPVWRFILPDGERTREITLTYYGYVNAGYRNGVLAIVTSEGRGYNSPLYTTTYTKSGIPVQELAAVGSSYSTADVVAPISFTEVGIGHAYLTGLFSLNECRYSVTTSNGVSVYNPWMGYSVYYSAGVHGGEQTSFVGMDQAYMYGYARLTDPEDQSVRLDEWVLLRWNIEDFGGAEEAARYTVTEPTNDFPPTPFGSFIQARTVNGETVRQLLDIATMEPLYTEALTALPGTARVRENTGWLWIEGYGVFQKTQLGWLMYPSSTYPRSAPWGMLGYAVHDVQIGRTGQANIVFE